MHVVRNNVTVVGAKWTPVLLICREMLNASRGSVFGKIMVQFMQVRSKLRSFPLGFSISKMVEIRGVVKYISKAGLKLNLNSLR